MEKNCLNCSNANEFENLYGKQCIRCWEDSNNWSGDHASVFSLTEARKYCCGSYLTHEEKEKEELSDAMFDYNNALSTIKRIREKYPDIENLIEEKNTKKD